MSDFGPLERNKRRRLQEAYADLRPEAKHGDDRQDKLRSLLLGAAADASLPGGSPQSVREAAAAAAASIAAVSGSAGGRGGTATGSRRGAPPGAAGSGCGVAPQRCLSAPAAAPGALLRSPQSLQARSPGPPTPHSGGGPGGGRHVRHLNAGNQPVRAPPPGPMEGGFLPEADPVARLSRLQGPHGAGGASAAAAGVMEAGAVARTEPGSGAGAPLGLAPGAAAAAAAAGRHPGIMGLRAAGARGAGGAAAAPAALQPPAAVRYGMPDEDDDLMAEVDVPSDVELALMSLKSDLRSHPASAELPPLALRSQLAAMLADRCGVERQLDEQQRANRVRVFKLPTGADEFGVMSTSDYRALVREAADTAAAAAAAAVAAVASTAATKGPLLPSQRAQSAPGALGTPAPLAASRPQGTGAYGTAEPSGTGGAGGGAGSRARGSRWHTAAEAFLRGVVDRFTEFQLSHTHLIHLLTTAQSQPQSQQQQQQQQQQNISRSAGQQRAGPPAGQAASMPSAEAVEEQLSLLLHLGCLARHTDGDADAYVLAVPGAGKLVKAVLGGRKELTTWLSKRQHREAPEEQIAKLRLRSSCLPPLYHVRDLVGRGGAVRLPSTSGHMIRLAGGKR